MTMTVAYTALSDPRMSILPHIGGETLYEVVYNLPAATAAGGWGPPMDFDAAEKRTPWRPSPADAIRDYLDLERDGYITLTAEERARHIGILCRRPDIESIAAAFLAQSGEFGAAVDALRATYSQGDLRLDV